MGAALFFTSQSKLLSPIPLTGLSAWWIGDNALYDGSNYVSQNNDVSINGNNQTQTTGGSQPLFVANAKNGHAAIRHDGSNDFLNFTNISNIRTVFAVVKNTNLLTASTLLGHSTLYDWHPDISYSGRMFDATYVASNVKNGTSYFNGIKKKPLDILYPQDYSILSFVTNGNVSADNFGKDRSTGTKYWNGDILEEIIYSAPLSDSDRIIVENYLSTKYSIPVYNYIDATSYIDGIIYTCSPVYSGSAAAIFDKSILGYTGWYPLSFPIFIKAQFPTAQILKGYGLMPQYVAGFPTRSPRDWKFQGSNDDLNWTDLHTVANEPTFLQYEKRSYVFANTTPYLYYRILISANSGSDSMWMTEMELYY